MRKSIICRVSKLPKIQQVISTRPVHHTVWKKQGKWRYRSQNINSFCIPNNLSGFSLLWSTFHSIALRIIQLTALDRHIKLVHCRIGLRHFYVEYYSVCILVKLIYIRQRNTYLSTISAVSPGTRLFAFCNTYHIAHEYNSIWMFL